MWSRAITIPALAAVLSGAPSAASAAAPGFGPLEVAVGVGGLAALGLGAWVVLLAGRRRRAAPERSSNDRSAGARARTAEEQVTATLHRRTLRRSRMRLDEDLIVSSMRIGAADAKPSVHSARRVTRRSPPT